MTVAAYGAYPDASVELRSRPEPSKEETPMQVEDRTEGGLAVEDRAETAGPSLEQRLARAGSYRVMAGLVRPRVFVGRAIERDSKGPPPNTSEARHSLRNMPTLYLKSGGDCQVCRVAG